MDMVFDENKKYKLIINRDGKELYYTATQMKVIGSLFRFNDREGKQFIFPLESLRQADEVRE